ncbi:hemolysin III [Stackebrandtia albiflava]|uniref:Hemolysin III n=1 Tax=Stackebrandtia albiflava TaxID=406432 RepID=A0A562UYF8_9ACTN|nr:hemolysin III family protein [Stackebrandtia albiflava]TWJ10674.1 hemolysin III [Stackebrandtia albiflava]
MSQAIEELVKPRLRGWLHTAVFPASLVAGVVLVLLAPHPAAAVSAGIYAVTSALLFGTSGYYHRRTHTPRADEVLRRIDHANIYLIIAGTYTPFAVIALDGASRLAVLLIIWIGAVAGVVFRAVWMSAPRWLYTSLYIGLGWVAVFFIPQFVAGVGVAAVILVFAGGILYSIGGVVYGLKRPDPSPRWFGFHEVFHSFTIAAWICQYAAVLLVVLNAR